MEFVIEELTKKYEEDAKDLLVELQSHIARLDDRGVIVLKESFRNDYFDFVSNEVLRLGGKMFVAVSGGHAVGIIICKIFQGGGEEEITTTCPKIGFISDLSVAVNARRQGIATALLTHAERFFKNSGCAYTHLEVFAPNNAALSLYSNYGFTPICTTLTKMC